MIEKISSLKTKVNSDEVKKLCEDAISVISSTIYNGVTPDAKLEIEKIAMTNLFEQLSKYKNVQGVTEWLKNQKRLYTIKNLGIRDAINSLNESDELNEVLDKFKDALNKGVHEARLYEQFITALSPFGYFPTVGNAIKAVEDRVNTYKSDVNITKIIETMKETRSNYLVPLIEDAVNDYLSEKNVNTKQQLTEILMKFTYDPFVRDIASLITLDATELQLEYASAQCDIDKVYSPVLYIGENEAVFAVNKEYYVKKGNNVSRLPEIEVLKLDNEFRTLCETLANPNVVVEKNSVSVYYGKDKAFISDSGVIVNDQKMTNEQFKESESISEWAGNRGFFQLVEFLRSNFNEIAEIDFVKRVYLKENEQHSANVFKLRDNVFITTHDPELGKSTFYRNINPIQAKNIMMEHLRFDVTSIYKGLLPNEEKIDEEINETKKEYNDYITELDKKITEFKLNPYGGEINEQVIEALEEELQEVKNDLKDYLNSIEKYKRAEAVNEDISVDVHVDGKTYTVPIPKEKVNGEERTENKNQEAGNEVGREHVEDTPASAITFNNDETELLSDSPTIPEDKIDMDSEKVEHEAEDAEEDAEEKEEEESEETKDKEEAEKEEDPDDIKIEDEVDSDQEDKEELKAKDKKEDDEDKEDDEEKKKGKKLEKLESSEGTGLTKKKFIKESDEKTNGKKKRVFLKKKVTEGISGLKSKTSETKTQKKELDKVYESKVVKKKSNNEPQKDTDEKLFEGLMPTSELPLIINKAQEMVNSDVNPDIVADYIASSLSDPTLAENILDDLVYSGMDVSEIVSKYSTGKTYESLNESAQVGDTVIFNKQKGNVIGQIGNDLIVQVQGSSHFAKPNEVKVKYSLTPSNITTQPPYKFSKETQKLLWEQYTRCGIFMGNIPVKASGCYVRYSDWNDAKDDEPINVVVEGQLSLLPKNQIKIFEDVNNFANLDNYVEGVQIDETTGNVTSNVRINAKDYVEALGDADPVRIIRGGDEENPSVDTVPKALLRTLTI